jgi:hypothetical protein
MYSLLLTQAKLNVECLSIAFYIAEDLPILEYREKVAFSSKEGGIVEFLKTEDISDLDAGFSNEEMALIRALSSMVESHLQDALLCELWSNDNTRIAQRIYFAALPWPLNRILHWQQQMRNRELLGLRRGNMESRTDVVHFHIPMEMKLTDCFIFSLILKFLATSSRSRMMCMIHYLTSLWDV